MCGVRLNIIKSKFQGRATPPCGAVDFACGDEVGSAGRVALPVFIDFTQN